MKELIFVRHGKSSWKYDVDDRERPLKSRGISDAKLVSQVFKNQNVGIDAIFSSPANRAYSTCKIFLQNMNFDLSKAIISDELYDFGGESVLNFIKNLDNSHNCVMLFGHNHAFTSLINDLGDRFIGNLPTSGLARITFDIEQWQHIRLGQTKSLIFPKDLKG